jgi:hypothetical protein
MLAFGCALAGVAASARTDAIPPPVEQWSADCRAPTYASDMTVCTDPTLRALDEGMAQLLAAAGERAIRPTSALVEGQAEWFRRRSLCAMQSRQRACLRAAYDERRMVLEVLVDGPATGGQVYRCAKAAGPLQDATILALPEGGFAVQRNGQAIGWVASRFDPAVWRPYVAALRSGKSLRISIEGGSPARCSLVS